MPFRQASRASSGELEALLAGQERSPCHLLLLGSGLLVRPQLGPWLAGPQPNFYNRLQGSAKQEILQRGTLNVFSAVPSSEEKGGLATCVLWSSSTVRTSL